MPNLVRMIRFSVSLGEMHETYKLLQSMKNSTDERITHFVENMRIRLRKKLMEEEEGLLGTAFTVLAEKKPLKYSMDALGLNGSNNTNDNSKPELGIDISDVPDIGQKELNAIDLNSPTVGDDINAMFLKLSEVGDPPIIAEIPNTAPKVERTWRDALEEYKKKEGKA